MRLYIHRKRRERNGQFSNLFFLRLFLLLSAFSLQHLLLLVPSLLKKKERHFVFLLFFFFSDSLHETTQKARPQMNARRIHPLDPHATRHRHVYGQFSMQYIQLYMPVYGQLDR